MLSLQGFLLALTEQQGSQQFGAPGSPCSQHSLVRGGYKKNFILIFHITMPWDLYSISTQISQNIFSADSERKSRTVNKMPFRALLPASPHKLREPCSGVGSFLPNPQGTCLVPVSPTLLQIQPLCWAISPVTDIARDAPVSKFDSYQVKSKLPSWQ